MLTFIPIISCIVLIYHQFVPDSPDPPKIIKLVLLSAELWIVIQNIVVLGENMIGICQVIVAIARYLS